MRDATRWGAGRRITVIAMAVALLTGSPAATSAAQEPSGGPVDDRAATAAPVPAPPADTVVAVAPAQLAQAWTARRMDRPRLPMHFAFDRNLPCTRVEIDIEPPWQRGSRPGYCGACAAVGYVIEPDGRTSSHRLLRVVPALPARRAGRLFAHVIQAMQRWRFEPAAGNPRREPVYTWYGYALILDQGITAEERDAAWERLEALCAVERFP